MERIVILYEARSAQRPRFAVRGRRLDGSVTLLGEIEYRKIPHLQQYGWEATGVDGSHRAVHDERWQAALALAWDGTGYPFPMIRPVWLQEIEQ
jgi:hypothetical protein